MRTGAVTALILLAAIVTGGVMLSGAAADAADECVSAANEAGTLCIMEDWTRAEALTADYAAKWKASRALLDLLLPKEMLDSVTEAYAELGTGIAFRDVQRCVEACGTLERHAEDVRMHERLTLENLL